MSQAKKIKLLVSVSGEDRTWTAGDVVELPADEAVKWADGVRATYADGSVDEDSAQTTADALAALNPEPVVVDVIENDNTEDVDEETDVEQQETTEAEQAPETTAVKSRRTRRINQ